MGIEILLVRAIGLNEEENKELNNLIRKWNHRRKSQNKREISYCINMDKKKRYSRDMWTRLYPKN